MLMNQLDYNSLKTLHVLLSEANVSKAAKRLNLSASAMSRALARLRHSTQDPLLVRSGQKMLLTPRAEQLHKQLYPLIHEIDSLLSPAIALDITQLERRFTLRCSEGFVENFGAALMNYLAQHAPRLKLHFLVKQDKSNQGLREGLIDLETTVVGESTGLDMRSRILFRDRFIAVARADHPIKNQMMSIETYAAAQHVLVARDPHKIHPVDAYLKQQQLTRQSTVSVAGFSAALALVRDTDLIATVPEKYTARLHRDLYRFELPFDLPEIALSLLWHPCLDTDQAHTWLRQTILMLCNVN